VALRARTEVHSDVTDGPSDRSGKSRYPAAGLFLRGRACPARDRNTRATTAAKSFQRTDRESGSQAQSHRGFCLDSPRTTLYGSDPMGSVQVPNKIEQFTMNVWAHARGVLHGSRRHIGWTGQVMSAPSSIPACWLVETRLRDWPCETRTQKCRRKISL
jgi:hypothetical protein